MPGTATVILRRPVIFTEGNEAVDTGAGIGEQNADSECRMICAIPDSTVAHIILFC